MAFQYNTSHLLQEAAVPSRAVPTELFGLKYSIKLFIEYPVLVENRS